MEVRRKLESVTPQLKNAGLFQNTARRMKMELTPIMHKNNRSDLIAMRLVKDDLEIVVTFVRRLVTDAASIIVSLNEPLEQKDHLADVKESRLPLRSEGAWQPQFVSDENGFEKRAFYPVTANWFVMNTN